MQSSAQHPATPWANELELEDIAEGEFGGDLDTDGEDAAASVDGPTAPPPTVQPQRSCWGSMLANLGPGCTANFPTTGGRFRRHFCSKCNHEGFLIDQSRVRVLPAGEKKSLFVNASAHGLWTAAYGLTFRVVNHTSRCRHVPLLILRDEASAQHPGIQTLSAIPP